MKEKLTRSIPLALILFIGLAFAKLHANKRSGSADECFTICSDARGYYAWLPAIFIYHDLNFHFYNEVELKDSLCSSIKEAPIQDYRYTFNGKACNKYYPGSAFMMLPFFAVAHFYVDHFTSYPPNGYSIPYFSIMAVAAVFYYLIGMLFFLKILGLFRLNNLQKSLTLLFVTFGSNMIYYVIDAPLYSHVYSFCLITAFLYYTLRLSKDFSAVNLAITSFLLGFIFITRPVNVSVMLLLPFIFHGKFQLLKKEIDAKPSMLLYLLPCLIMPAILLTLYKIATGQFFLFSYNKEGFDFLHPHFFDFIFHYDNGILPYTPILLIPFLLLFAWYKKEHKNILWGIIITILLTIYIHSSWWCWNYSFSFGPRTMLDFASVFGVLIGLSLKQENKKRYYYILPVYFLCSILTVLLYHQKSANHFMEVYPIRDYWQAIGNALSIN